MYADDVVLLYSFQLSSASTAAANINRDLHLIAEWASSNSLHLNPSKSSLLIAGSPFHLSHLPSFNIFINQSQIPQSSSIKILGVHFDSSWSFDQHVLVKSRAAFLRLRLLYPFRHILSTSQKLLISQLLVISLFDYSNSIYIPALSQKLLTRVQRIQNTCLRFSFNVRKYDHISPYFSRSGWLNIRQRFILHLCCLVFRLLHSGVPRYLRNLLYFNSDLHANNTPDTRHQDSLSYPRHRTSKFKAAFSYTATKFYNAMPSFIRLSPSLPSFRSRALEYISTL
ncbi:hypothetical protein ALC62_12662 [Cyphomyrmex costatus]|uniref:Reverse transcriptase domain-containing protein n=1 Tax=Cyphomyrmex costatus TaxID=456900 RepID=A0A151IBC2_9HYME|nr:hypothetical protein ALC62_12662 [Cyphomyrmex costatus]